MATFDGTQDGNGNPMVPKMTKTWYMKSYNLKIISESILSLLWRFLWTFCIGRFQGKNLDFWKFENMKSDFMKIQKDH